MKNKNSNQEFIGKYKTFFGNAGKSLQVTAYYSYFDRENFNKSVQKDIIQQIGIADNILKLNNFYTKYDLELPFDKLKFTVNTGGKLGVLSSQSIGKYNFNNTNNDISVVPDYNQQLSFDYAENTFALYVELKKKIGKLNVTAGLRMEDLKYKSIVKELNIAVNQHINHFFPTFHLLYNLVPNVDVIASYTKKINLPAYGRLDPNNSGYFDKYSTSTGNPYLKPNFYSNFSFKISAFDWLQAGMDYSRSKDVNFWVFETPELSLNTVQTFQTFDAINYFSAYASLPVPFGFLAKGMDFFSKPFDMDKASGVFLYASFNNHEIENFPYLQKQKPFWQFYTQLQLIFPYKIKLAADYSFMTKGTFQIYQLEKPVQMLNMNISRKFLNDKLLAEIHLVDVLKSVEIGGMIPSINLITNQLYNYDSRVCWLKLTYHFGKGGKKAETEIHTEKKEIDAGGGFNKLSQ
jgi:hypothetical protein